MLTAFIASCAMTSRLRAQSSESTAISMGIGYSALSIGAIAALVTMPHEAPIEAGRMIRVGGSGNGYRVGRVVAVDGNRLTLDTDAGQTTISADSLGDVEVSLGNNRRWAQGWGIGFVAGAGVGGLLGFASGDDPPGTFIRLNAEQKALLAGSLLGVGGSVVGTLIGLAGPERWVHATRPSTASRVSINPIVGSRVGLSAKIAF